MKKKISRIKIKQQNDVKLKKEVILKKIVWLMKVKEKALMKLLDKMLRYKTMLLYCLKCKKY